jgi:hypothetical protein
LRIFVKCPAESNKKMREMGAKRVSGEIPNVSMYFSRRFSSLRTINNLKDQLVSAK